MRRVRTDARAHHWHVPPTPSPSLSKLLFLLVRPIKRAPRHLSRRIRARMPGTKHGYVVFLPICRATVSLIDIGSDRTWSGFDVVSFSWATKLLIDRFQFWMENFEKKFLEKEKKMMDKLRVLKIIVWALVRTRCGVSNGISITLVGEISKSLCFL